MGFNTFLTLATLGLAAAESSVVSLFMFDVNPENPQTLVGSIMGAVRIYLPSPQSLARLTDVIAGI